MYLFFFFFFSTGLTVMYSFRLIYYCMMIYMNFKIINMFESMNMIYPMFTLLIMSILGGSMLSWLIFPFYNFILLNLFIKMMTLMICFFGMFVGIYFNGDKIKYYNYKFIKVKYFISNMWFMPIIFCYYLNYLLMKLPNKYKMYIDMGWIELYSIQLFKNNILIIILYLTKMINMFSLLMIIMLIVFWFFM